MMFFVGLHQPHVAHRFPRAFISVNRLRARRSMIDINEWIMDSGAFTAVVRDGGYRFDSEEYASQIRRFSRCGTLLRAVAQDYMCEPIALAATGLTVADHQALTIARYDELIACDTGGIEIMPVLQGYSVADYVRHLEAYGDRLTTGMWVGVGSVCKRQGRPEVIAEIVNAIRARRPDLRLHGFGLKSTTLCSWVRHLFYSADSMAWSFAARRDGRDANDWREADAFRRDIERAQPEAIYQGSLNLEVP